MPAGKNTELSEDGTQLLSKIEGQILVRNDKYNIEQTLTIDGNVDFSIGNLDVTGNLVVQGDICSGFEVRATGDITVNGMIEGASVVAGGNIFVRSGMNGNSKGVLTAGKDIRCKFMENTVLTLFVLITLTFFMMRMLPGDPFLGDKTVTGAALENMKAKYGLDKPVIVQYFIYLGNCVRGDLGTSITYNKPVRDIISEAFLVSADLGIRALIFAVIAGVLLGMVAAVKRGSAWDSVSMFIAMIGVSVPSFIMGALFQYFLALQLRKVLGFALFPVQGWGDFSKTILPSFALGLGSLATVSRLMRTSMLDVLNQDYIKTAKAKGLSQNMIIIRHNRISHCMPDNNHILR